MPLVLDREGGGSPEDDHHAAADDGDHAGPAEVRAVLVLRGRIGTAPRAGRQMPPVQDHVLEHRVHPRVEDQLRFARRAAVHVEGA